MLQTSFKPTNPALLQLQMAYFGRRKSNFVKKLGVYSYKITSRTNKGPHQINLQQREAFKKLGNEGLAHENERRRLSNKPFGRHTSLGRFMFDIEKVPFYNIPDLEGFTLKPYVACSTPKIS
jgi:large subunit ribosomal protein L41